MVVLLKSKTQQQLLFWIHRSIYDEINIFDISTLMFIKSLFTTAYSQHALSGHLQGCCAGWFYVNELASFAKREPQMGKKLSLLDWPVGESVVPFLS